MAAVYALAMNEYRPTVRREVARLAALAREAADEIEISQRLPDELVKGMSEAGLLSLYVRRSIGGPGIDPVTAYEAVEELARADGSVGWCSMVAGTSAYLTGWIPDDVAVEMFGTPADVRLAGSSRPLGTAAPVPGGYRVSGRWDFCSGIRHANWLMGACIVEDGSRSARVMFVPTTSVTVVPTWNVLGMRGTGSHDVVVDDVFVPESHSALPNGAAVDSNPVYHPRMMRVVTHAPVAAVALGIARGAIDGLIALADRSTTLTETPLRARPDVHLAIADATARVEAARSYVMETLVDAWQRACEDRDLGDSVARSRIAIAHAGFEARRAVQTIFDAAGTNAIFAANPLERRLRDIHVALRFPAFERAVRETAGRVLLGDTVETSGW